jgi:hypothetical protein
MTLEVKGKAGDRQIEYTFDSGAGKESRTLSFDELSNPTQLTREFGFPLVLMPFAGLMSSNNTATAKGLPLGAGIKWEAHYDWLTIGHSRVRVYKLEARLLDKFRASLLVSRVGEILRVDLPNELSLVNDALTNL